MLNSLSQVHILTLLLVLSSSAHVDKEAFGKRNILSGKCYHNPRLGHSFQQCVTQSQDKIS